MQCGQEICFAQRACYYPCLQANKPAGQQLSLTLRPLAQHLLLVSSLLGEVESSWARLQVGSNSGGITALTTGNFLCQCQRLCRQRLAVSKLFPFDRRPRINEATRLSRSTRKTDSCINGSQKLVLLCFSIAKYGQGLLDAVPWEPEM